MLDDNYSLFFLFESTIHLLQNFFPLSCLSFVSEFHSSGISETSRHDDNESVRDNHGLKQQTIKSHLDFSKTSEARDRCNSSTTKHLRLPAGANGIKCVLLMDYFLSLYVSVLKYLYAGCVGIDTYA